MSILLVFNAGLYEQCVLCRWCANQIYPLHLSRIAFQVNQQMTETGKMASKWSRLEKSADLNSDGAKEGHDIGRVRSRQG